LTMEQDKRLPADAPSMQNHGFIESERSKLLEMYRLAHSAYRLEVDRSRILDEKATRHLTVLTFLLGLMGFVGRWLAGNLVPVTDRLGLALWLLSAALLASLVGAWFCVFFSLRLWHLKLIGVDEPMIEYFRTRYAPTVYHGLARRLAKVNAENEASTDSKALLLDRAHRMMLASSLLFVAIAIVFAFRVFVHGA